MSSSEKIYCVVCARQSVSYVVSDEHCVGPRSNAVAMVGGVCCHECARDLDENGLFPEEKIEIVENEEPSRKNLKNIP